MSRLTLFIIAITFIILPATLRAQDPVPFGDGEMLNYAIKWGFITAGYADLSVQPEIWNDQKVYHIISTARTNKFMDALYKVRDKNESIVSREPFCSLKFIKDLNEGKYRDQEEVIFNQTAGKSIYPNGEEIDMVTGTVDVLAALYYVRILDLQIGKELTVPSCNNKKNYQLVVKVVRREKIKVAAGEFDTIMVEPKLMQAGIFMNKGRLFVYLTDDRRRIPVLLRSKIAVGSISAELIGMDLNRGNK